ncbi:hypothetical protein AX17_007450 [Amanita inopinata Kibby_2008]|nr:hypothetical protein AX17_007450 [Amanita inopinata Kibby_2008]
MWRSTRPLDNYVCHKFAVAVQPTNLIHVSFFLFSQLITSTQPMLKQHIQSILRKCTFKRMFRRKKSRSSDASGATDADAKTAVDVAPNGNDPQAEKLGNVAITRSSSSTSRSSDKPKPSSPSAGVVQDRKDRSRSGSFEAIQASEERASSTMRKSESLSISPTMPQLPTILVGEDLEPLDLTPRKDSEHLPRDENGIDQGSSPMRQDIPHS